MSPLLTPLEAAEILQVTTHTLAAWRREDRGPAYIEVGGQIRYDTKDLQRWLDAQTKLAPSA